MEEGLEKLETLKSGLRPDAVPDIFVEQVRLVADAFERMLPFREHLPAWQALKQAAQSRVHAPNVAVFAGDVSFRLTDFATRNAERAGVSHAIEFKTVDALQRMPPAPSGVKVQSLVRKRNGPSARRT